MKVVTPSGELLEVTEEQPKLLRVMRSSYGLLGIVCEVTFRIKPLRPMAVRHESYSVDEFEVRLLAEFPARQRTITKPCTRLPRSSWPYTGCIRSYRTASPFAH